ncbi:hypothetical protein TIFTF001_030682 [Ficus carica]|uniref:Uncharacterized protein n=1 Tax=Ficus carica TaxID=3494 RepID=A0AA88DTP3_FICCA|nr:hypothetical protein TIFTF001_030682 [Ficus carica]
MIMISSGTLQRAIRWPKDILIQTHRKGHRQRKRRAQSVDNHKNRRPEI